MIQKAGADRKERGQTIKPIFSTGMKRRCQPGWLRSGSLTGRRPLGSNRLTPQTEKNMPRWERCRDLKEAMGLDSTENLR